MPPSPLRVIFDRSAFHGPRYRRLRDSRLRDLCRLGRIVVYHTPVFLNETISTYRPGEQDADWQTHLQFALDTCNGGIFLNKEAIWYQELVVGRGPRSRCLLPERRNKNFRWSRPELMAILRNVARTGDLAEEWLASEPVRNETRRRMANQRQIFSRMRQEVARNIRENRPTDRLSEYPFRKFLRTVYSETGQELMNLVHPRRTKSLAEQWARCPERFPYYSAFIEGLLYSAYYAAVKHNDPIDENAQADYEQLAYLAWADIVVSNDRRFFLRAFEEIWKPREKRLETAESFSEFVNRIA